MALSKAAIICSADGDFGLPQPTKTKQKRNQNVFHFYSYFADLPVLREMSQIISDLADPHFDRVPLSVKEDEIPDVIDVGFVRAATEVTGPDQVLHLIEQFRFRHNYFGEGRIKVSPP